MRNGYTFAELLIVIAIMIILSLVSFANFVSRRNHSSLTSTASAMAGLLREAQGRAMAQASSTSWGVHFENGTPAFFALFSVPYASSSLAGYYSLPAFVQYASSSIAQGSYAEVIFSQLSGVASGSSSVTVQLSQDPTTSSTITVASSGAVAY